MMMMMATTMKINRTRIPTSPEMSGEWDPRLAGKSGKRPPDLTGYRSLETPQ